MNLSKERAKVKKRFPGAHAYKWGPRDWVIYAAKDGPLQGIAITRGCSSLAHAWISAARDVYSFLRPGKVKLPRKRRVSPSGDSSR